MHLLPLIACLIVFVLYLVYERLALDRHRNTISLRIAVTGTRGKSSVTRLIAAILREDGRRVVAKTTGSQARLILPDAGEVEITRRGIPSIIEQKKLIKKAAQLKADCLVAEIMSIHPENHFVESQQILRSHLVVVTNFHLDHTEAVGETKEEIAAVYGLDIPPKARVFALEKDKQPIFAGAIARAEGELVLVQEGVASSFPGLTPELRRWEFAENLDLVCGLAGHLGIDHHVVINGIRKAKPDIGKLGAWIYRSPETDKAYYLVNAFAANDPESTRHAISRVQELLPAVSGKLIGLLSLRGDRADRSAQWITALRSGAFDCFSRIYVTGAAHASVVKRRLNSAFILKSRQPKEMMATVLAELEDRSVIVGFGNMKGTGELLVDLWSRVGEAYDL